MQSSIYQLNYNHVIPKTDFSISLEVGWAEMCVCEMRDLIGFVVVTIPSNNIYHNLKKIEPSYQLQRLLKYSTQN